ALVVCTDVEHGEQIDPRLVELAQGADLLVHDAQYTAEELQKRRGWGHSSFDQAMQVAEMAGVKRLALTHHDPEHDDEFLQRIENNATMAQWTVIRMAIAKDRDIAELMTAGLHGERSMDAADPLRLEQMLAEYAWASFHIWDRTQRGVFPKGTFEATAGVMMCDLLRTQRGEAWWRSAKH